jgi:hypothetical protein
MKLVRIPCGARSEAALLDRLLPDNTHRAGRTEEKIGKNAGYFLAIIPDFSSAGTSLRVV